MRVIEINILDTDVTKNIRYLGQEYSFTCFRTYIFLVAKRKIGLSPSAIKLNSNESNRNVITIVKTNARLEAP